MMSSAPPTSAWTVGVEPIPEARPLPLHRWRLPAMALVVRWKRFQDWLDAR